MLTFRLLAVASIALVSQVAHASAQRTFVSTAGDDANVAANCSPTASCAAAPAMASRSSVPRRRR